MNADINVAIMDNGGSRRERPPPLDLKATRGFQFGKKAGPPWTARQNGTKPVAMATAGFLAPRTPTVLSNNKGTLPSRRKLSMSPRISPTSSTSPVEESSDGKMNDLRLGNSVQQQLQAQRKSPNPPTSRMLCPEDGSVKTVISRRRTLTHRISRKSSRRGSTTISASGAGDVDLGILRLSYNSKLTQEGAPKLLRREDEFRYKNMSLGLTGVLLCDFQDTLNVFQTLEGFPEDVRKLVQRIKADPMHNNLTVVEEVFSSTRKYSRWGMIESSNEDIQNLASKIPATHRPVLTKLTKTDIELEASLGKKSIFAEEQDVLSESKKLFKLGGKKYASFKIKMKKGEGKDSRPISKAECQRGRSFDDGSCSQKLSNTPRRSFSSDSCERKKKALDGNDKKNIRRSVKCAIL